MNGAVHFRHNSLFPSRFKTDTGLFPLQENHSRLEIFLLDRQIVCRSCSSASYSRPPKPLLFKPRKTYANRVSSHLRRKTHSTKRAQDVEDSVSRLHATLPAVGDQLCIVATTGASLSFLGPCMLKLVRQLASGLMTALSAFAGSTS